MDCVTGPVTVEVPATSANLGPGFDCLGLALGLHDRVTAEVTGSGLVVEVAGEGADEVARDERHLVVRAMREAFAAMSVDPPGLVLRCENAIPHGRGLGSSSAAIVGGLVLARALVPGGVDRFDDEAALVLATAIEGHPDNVAPALLGGLVVCGRAAGGEVWAHRVPVDPRIEAVAFVPPEPLSTETARGLLPDRVSHADAAANSARTALLVAALSGAPDRLWRGTEDFLHQAHRAPAMPESLALVDGLRAEGVPAFVSGAGPGVLALAGVGDGLVDPGTAQGRCPDGWTCRRLRIEDRGARVC